MWSILRLPNKKNKNKNKQNKQRPKRQTPTRKRPNRQSRRPRLSPDGIAFLKCATASPDFDGITPAGVPDMYGGKTVVKNDLLTQSISMAPGTVTYLLSTPTPGVAAWKCTLNKTALAPTGFELPAGSTFTPILFPDTTALFPNAVGFSDLAFEISNTTEVDRFRTVAMSAELASTNNNFDFAGTITAFRTPLQLTTSSRDSLAVDAKMVETLTGIDGIGQTSNSSQVYVSDTKSGVYTVSMHRDSTFEFCDIRDNVNALTSVAAPFGTVPAGNSAVNFIGPMLGMDNFDSILFRVDVPLGAAAQTFFFRRWQTTEYQPVQSSMLHQFSRFSPPPDEAALLQYKYITSMLPIGVPSAQNESFWRRILGIIRGIATPLSFIPGPIGEIATGVNMVATAAGTF